MCLIGLTPALRAQTTQPIVAIHDSELTRGLESQPATGTTPTGSGTTGFQWWPTDWHYFVMPESVKEALRSDGTAFTVIGDSNINAGLLLPNGSPKYPIVISLAAEAIQNSEIAQLTNYVAAGGYLVVGSSAFTRNPDGTSRGDFAFANELGAHVITPGLLNWANNTTFTKAANHRLVSHVPDGQLYWRMPSAAEEISWGTSPTYIFEGAHDIWQVQASDATVIAQADASPYLTVKKFGKGYFIYVAGFQPLIGHGGFAPSMYAYAIFRQAIEWAFESAKLPVTKLSPWPYQYDAAFIVRHDLEDFPSSIAHIEASAQVENSLGAKGDYYFCTGTLREGMEGLYDTNEVIMAMQRAVVLYGASVGPHNGGLRNPRTPSLTEPDYDFWHWGPDEALDVTPDGYPDGKTYAMASIAASFMDVENWLPGLMTSDMRMWVAPRFNATREDSFDIQAQLGVKIAGDQKLTPFPHWTLSTRTPGKRYPMLSEPVSDWFVGGLVAQSLEPWHAPGIQTSATLHDAVDFYYGLGGLLNFYCHTLATGEGDAGPLMPDYMTYCLNTNLHPRMWSANAIGIYDWWSKRASAQIAVSYTTNGNQSVTTVAISGATDPRTTVEILVPAAGQISTPQIFLNGVSASASSYRINGRVIKLLVGTSVTSAQISYSLLPVAANDFYQTPQGTTLTVAAPGILSNDQSGSGNASLTAVLATGTAHGTLSLSANGAFTYTPTNNHTGADSFTYRASNGQTSSAPATVNLNVTRPGELFSDDFTRATPSSQIAPWTQQIGTWSITNGALVGVSAASSYGNAYYNDSAWTDYTVQARLQFSSSNALGGGLGGRLNPISGEHYAAWIYPEGSAGGSTVLKLIKFTGWTSWSGTPMQTVSLPGVGTNWHNVALSFQGTNILVSYDGVPMINAPDNNFDSVAPYATGGISVDMYTYDTPYTLAVDDLSVISLVAATPPVITTQPASRTNSVGTSASFTVVASGTPLNYQWRFNGTNIAGATASTYTLGSVLAANAGNYTVVVSNQVSSVTSSNATLTVIAAPVIVTQPVSRTNAVGTSASFTVAVSGTALAFQWKFNGTNIAGAITNTYTLTSVQATNAGNYTVVVSNPAGSVTSSVATLTVIMPKTYAWSVPVAITTAERTLNLTGNIVGAAVFGGADTLVTLANGSVILFKADGSVASATGAGGATLPTYESFFSSSTTGNANFNSVLNQGAYDNGPHTITLKGLTVGQQYTVQLFALDDRGGVIGTRVSSFQDPKDASDVSATFAMGDKVYVIGTFVATSANMVIQQNLPISNNGAINAGNINALVVRAISETQPPIITSQPASRTNKVGTSASFSVVATGNALRYQWKFNGANIAGATNSTYTLASVQAANAGNYTVVVSNLTTSVTSSPATLTVIVPPTITTQPVSRTNAVGTSASFSVVATGTALTYQWQFNGANIAGATSSTYMLASVQTNNAGNYIVVVSNVANKVTSAIAKLTVTVPTPPAITKQPQSLTVTAGQSATFSVTATGTAPLRYQWRFNGVNLAGATNSTYTVANAQSTNAGSYTVVVSNLNGTVTSSAATLNVKYSLAVTTTTGGSVTVTPSANTYTAGSKVTLVASPSFLFRFTGWSGDASGTSSTLTVTMNSNKVIKANFVFFLF